MKSKDIRKVVLRMAHDGMSSLQIAKLRKVVSERTVRRWQHLYRSTDTIDLKTPADRPRVILTKCFIRKVKNRFIYKGPQSARKLANSLGISKETIGRIIHEDFHLHVYRVTIESNLNDEHKQRRESFTYWPNETLTHENYIETVLPHARTEGQLLLGDGFIYQQDNATLHKDKHSIAWIKKIFPRFIDDKEWSPNSPDHNVLDYYVWDAIGHNMHWNKVKSYDSLIDEIKKV
ncbi:unnamed protein product [Rotaria socialis]|uniref:Transposase n=2 Tax=Rotaria socialis TaxID=392032 RepID=A0A818X1Y7_9BILA|nr:unnamed protein product [Rotaria socialis]